MATYATAAELKTYAPSLENLADEPAEALLDRAERDVDRAIGGPTHPDRRRRLDPEELTDPQQEALSRAACAAAEFRAAQGEAKLIGADDGVTEAGSVTIAPRASLPRVGPKLREELAGFALTMRSGTVTPPPTA